MTSRRNSSSGTFRYPGPDGRLNTDDDFEKRNELHVVVDKNYEMDLHAEDVIHSFWIPSFRIKQDAVPGLVIRAWFNANRIGEYELGCAELCGLGHYRMRARVFVIPRPSSTRGRPPWLRPP